MNEKTIEALLHERAELVNKELAKSFAYKDADTDKLTEAMEYSTMAGGKRIRPYLVFAFSEAFGGRETEALVYAASLELVHTYSLIHDDMPCMDNDDYRRGRLTCHKVYGEATAMLAGDALLTAAFEKIAYTEGITDKNKIRAVGIIASAAGMRGMIGGQEIDLKAENSDISYETMTKMHSLKTCALIKAACLLGALSADMTDTDVIERVCSYGEGIGRAFQLIDDILDVTSTDEKLGKPVHSDEKNNKTTYMSFMPLEMARQLAGVITDKAVEAAVPFDKNGELEALAYYLHERKK